MLNKLMFLKTLELLWVDEDKKFFDQIKTFIRNIFPNINLTLLEDGIETLVYLRQEGRYRYASRPDLIFLNLQVSRLNGYQLVEILKNNDIFKGIPVVALIEPYQNNDFIRLKSFDDLMMKPFNTELISDMIRKFCTPEANFIIS